MKIIFNLLILFISSFLHGGVGTWVLAKPMSKDEISKLTTLLSTNNQSAEIGLSDKFRLNLQGKLKGGRGCSTKDQAPQPLFGSVNYRTIFPRTKTNDKLLYLFNTLLDNYNSDVKSRDIPNKREEKEKKAFTDALFDGPVMREAYSFLKHGSYFSGTYAQLESEFKTMWFANYDRDGDRKTRTLGSSGFEHVFVGEKRDNSILGFHNWIQYLKKENGSSSNLNYLGYDKKVDLPKIGTVVKLRMTWQRKPKCITSIATGIRPEKEIALYTICYYVNNRGKSDRCRLSAAVNSTRTVKIAVKSINGNKIGTAYFDI